uniref:Uncharacterized protein n=1 Tax=Oryza barthii TaxID=65489 RepID=A0A0D3FV15_9ORYZ
MVERRRPDRRKNLIYDVCHEGLRPTCQNHLNHQTSAKSQMDTKGETKGCSPWVKPDDED